MDATELSDLLKQDPQINFWIKWFVLTLHQKQEIQALVEECTIYNTINTIIICILHWLIQSAEFQMMVLPLLTNHFFSWCNHCISKLALIKISSTVGIGMAFANVQVIIFMVSEF